MEESLEDGTPAFQQISALKHGFDALDRLGGGMDKISEHVFGLARAMHARMKELRHENGQQLVKIYAATGYDDIKAQGGIVTFNLVRSDGSHFGYHAFRRLAELERVRVRTGCFCNVGACQVNLGSTDKDALAAFDEGHVCGDDVDVVRGGSTPTGAVRVSFGYYNTMGDVDKVLSILERHFLNAGPALAAAPSRPAHLRARVHGLCLYPVKSCAPTQVQESWPAGEEGLLHDRRWVVMDQRYVNAIRKANHH